MENTEFNGWLRKGLGRAVVFLDTHDPYPYREAALHACTHEVGYEVYSLSREEYYLDLIRSFRDDQFFRDGFLETLVNGPKDPDKYDLGQTITLARNFAQKGDLEVKQAMYDAISRAGFSRAGWCCEDLIILDGIDGLLFAADLLPSAIDDDELFQASFLIHALEDRDGAESAKETIQNTSLQHPSLARMLELSEAAYVARKLESSERYRGERPDYPALKGMIWEGEAERVLHAWSKTASPEELREVADDLLVEQDETRLLAYLRIFREQQFPRPFARILELAQHQNIRIARAAIRLLSQLKAPAIRSLALNLLRSPATRGDAADLLMNNFEPGDFQTFEALLREPMEIEDLHRFGFGIREIVELHCPAEAERCLLLLYEIGPCSLCRKFFVKPLITLQRLPDWARIECRFDADAEVRELVL
jgi:hypothetical protein